MSPTLNDFAGFLKDYRHEWEAKHERFPSAHPYRDYFLGRVHALDCVINEFKTVVQTQPSVEAFEASAGFSEQFAMGPAMEELKAVFKNRSVVISFEVAHDPASYFTVPCFYATAGSRSSGPASTPLRAVKKLLKKVCITGVEAYIRCKEAAL